MGENEYIIDFESGSHTVPNLLRDYAWKEKDVVFSGYSRGHLLVGKTRYVIKVKKGDAKKTLEKVLDSIKKDIASLKKAIK